MSDETRVIVVALLGGVSGALLTGIFNSIIGVLGDRRKQHHELDAWLRDKRYQAATELLQLASEAPYTRDPLVRADFADRIWRACINLQTVAPKSLRDALTAFRKLMAEELSLPPTVRGQKAMAWQSGHLQASVQIMLGASQEPVIRQRPRSRLLTRAKRYRRPASSPAE